MRTTEAERYARWSVILAALLAAGVAGVYAWSAWQARQAHTDVLPPVPAAVQQRSAEFTFSKVVGNNTRFILRASRATEFKEGGRTLLDDVWITAFGGNGKRSDQLHTAACEYLAISGLVSCPEQVLIDLQSGQTDGANPQGDSSAGTGSGSVRVVTSRLSFNRDSGVAATTEPVQFQFAGGEGRANGLNYNSQIGELHLLHDVELVFESVPGPSSPPASTTPGSTAPDSPMTVSSEELIYRRGENVIHLNGAATMRRSGQELRAGRLKLELDGDMKARRLIADDHPILLNPSGSSTVSLSADELTAPVVDAGRLGGVLATGHVVLDALRPDGRHHMTAESSSLEMIPESQQPRHFTATGNVNVTSTSPDGSTRHLQTNKLEVSFVNPDANSSHLDRAIATPGTMEWENASRGAARQNSEAMRLKGHVIDGSFDEAGELRELRATGNVEVQKGATGQTPVTSTSRALVARIGQDGQWSTIEQSGDVRLKNATGEARGALARFNRIEDTVALSGSVVMTDPSSQTHADRATFWQSAGKLRADGNVATTELAADNNGNGAGATPEPAHITAAGMTSDTASGRAVYSGKARLWQGASVVQADTIDLDRPRSTMIATGNVSAVFPEADKAGPTPGRASPQKQADRQEGPRFWHAQGGQLVYEEGQHRARLEEAARATSPDGSVEADRLDLFFAPRPGEKAASGGPGAKTPIGASLEGTQVQKAQGFGHVRVESAHRVGTGETGEYSAEEGKFVLFGGRPTLIDQFGNTTAGRQLTFFFADDRIVVDSAEGSRTLTLHQVEK